MAYFSNGTEGQSYVDRYCSKCVHFNNGACPVWDLHMLHNYRDCNNPDSMLHVLIPRSADKLGNEQCTMFYANHPRRRLTDHQIGTLL